MASPSLPPFSRRRLLPFPLPVGGPHPSCSAMFWTTTEPTVNALPMAELQQQPQEPAPWNWSPGLLCMQQQQQQQEHHQQQGGGDGGCSSADDASPFAAAAAAQEPCFADYPPGVLSALESVPFSLHATELDLGQWQVYLSHFIPGMQVVDSFQDLTLDQREQAIKFASDMALAQAGVASAPEPCLQQQQRPDLPHALPVDGCGRWNYGFPGEEDRDQLVTTALLPTCFREDGEQAALAELGTSQTCEEFHRRLSCSRQYFLCEAGQGRDGGGPPAFLAQEIEHQPFLGSSSDCVHEANSCASDNVIGESAPNLSTNWRGLGVPVLHVPELSIVELPDESSSVANDADNLDSTMHSRFKQLPQLDPIDSTLPCGSWIPQCRASDSESSGSMQEAGKNFDPATWTARPPSLMIANTLPPLSTIVVNLEEEEAVAFKRQRVACYTMESLSEAVNLHLEKEALAAGALMATPLVNALARPILYGDAEKTREFSLANRTAFTQDRARPPFQSTHLEQRGPADAKPCYRKIPTTSVEPQSVAARQRRKKISERVRVLEQLIPGGHKMDTASMLDEAIEYVKFLQLQVNILESLGSITDQAHSPAISSSSNNGYGLDLGRETSFSAFEGGPGHGLRSSTLLSVPARPSGGCPLILSEVLQQQLFKHKLCIVSLRQCALPSSSS